MPEILTGLLLLTIDVKDKVVRLAAADTNIGSYLTMQ